MNNNVVYFLTCNTVYRMYIERTWNALQFGTEVYDFHVNNTVVMLTFTFSDLPYYTKISNKQNFGQHILIKNDFETWIFKIVLPNNGSDNFKTIVINWDLRVLYD